MSTFSPIHKIEGYLPIEDHGLIGDGTTAALVGRDGAISWMCVPRFDSPPLFCGLLDGARGGGFGVAPDDVVDARQFYEPDSAVLVTEIRARTGLVRITDALTLRAGADLTENTRASRGELLRLIAVREGEARLRIAIEPRGGAAAEPISGGLKVRCAARPDLDLHLSSSWAFQELRTVLELKGGDHGYFLLRWCGGPQRHHPIPPEGLLETTLEAWRRWLRHLEYDGPQSELVRRSAITLKLLDHFENGSMVAAPTSSLPEAIGGVRNWDYRYSWIRDAAFSVYALRRIGLVQEAEGFLAWVLDAVERDGRPRVLYNLDGAQPPQERTDEELEGYRRSRPVRWGNAAADQLQHDVYGEILDCAYQWAAHGNAIDENLWTRLRALVEAAAREWNAPDHGIWEVRTAGRTFTYSAALCQVALDRGVRGLRSA
jgi:GH15 family glucan-1,4-alpha-glucosidase